MQFVKTHWKQLATLILSLAVGVLLHLGKLSADQATAIGAGLALIGIHLAPITYGKAPPMVPPSMLASVVVCSALLVGGSMSAACTPAEQQQVAKIAPEAAACVFAVVEDVSIAPDIAGTVAKCGVTVADIYALVQALMAKGSDAGAMGAAQSDAHLKAWLDAAIAADRKQ